MSLVDPRLAGRARELGLLHAGLDDAQTSRNLRAFRLAGRPGHGKTALLGSFLSSARSLGWAVLHGECLVTDEAAPLAALTRALFGMLRTLGTNGSRYWSGLEESLAAADPAFAAMVHHSSLTRTMSPPEFERLLVRVLDGVVADYPLVIALDDVQWIDPESVRVIEHVLQSLPESPVVFVAARRVGSPDPFRASAHATDVVVGTVSGSAAGSIVREHFPAVNDEVLATIVDYAAGVPLDLVTLSTQAHYDQARTPGDVAESFRAVIVNTVATLGSDVRVFLQLCSIVQEPIDVRILASLNPDTARLSYLIAACPREYLIQEGGHLRFVHTLIAEAVRSTIAVELPLQRRVLEALLPLDDATVAHYERVVHHAEACGELDVQYRYLCRQAEETFGASSWDLAAAAFRRALALRAPSRDEHIGFFTRYSTALQGADQDAEAEAVLRSAIQTGKAMKLSQGLGALAALLIRNLWDLQKTELALATYDYYRELLTTNEDQGELLAIGAHLFADTLDRDRFAEVVTAFATLGEGVTAHARGRVKHSEAIVFARLGENRAAQAALNAAAAFAHNEPSLLEYRLPLAQVLIEVLNGGCQAIRTRLPVVVRRTSLGSGTFAFTEFMGLIPDVASGEWERALEKVAQSNLSRLALIQRARMLCVPALVWAFSGRRPTYADDVELSATRLVEENCPRSGLELGAWWLAARGRDIPDTDARARRVFEWAAGPGGMSTLCYMPVALALYAERAGSTRLLDQIRSASGVEDRSPWMRAHWSLARGYATCALGREEGRELCRSAADQFELLQAPLLAAFAAAVAGSATRRQSALLDDLGIVAGYKRTSAGRKTAQMRNGTKRDGLTPREREVADLVAHGETNREIARTLFLSERTVEVHLSNAFGKLGLSSRSQLTRWVIERNAELPNVVRS